MLVALHPEGVDRNDFGVRYRLRDLDVALHPEGVDRNGHADTDRGAAAVALHPEGVDRNPSTSSLSSGAIVALHPEGVDRNSYTVLDDKIYFRRPPPKGRG